jgi:hypothetical protein
MIEVICAGSLFLSTNACLDTKSLDLVSINTTKSTLIQSNIGQNEIYMADNESESDLSRELEQLVDQFDIIIQDSSSQNSDFDADERRRELELENGQYDWGNEEESDNSDSDEFDADERRQELELENGQYDSGDEQESEYRQQADEARDGHDTNASDSDSDSDSSDSDEFDADERRQELEMEEGESDSGDEQESNYRQQADEARE